MGIEQSVFYSIALIAMIGATCIVALVVWSRPEIPGSKALSGSLWAIALWLLVYLFELHVIELSSKAFWSNSKYVVITSIFVLWMIFTVYYSQRKQWLTKRNLLILFTVPVVISVCSLTNGAHGVMWTDIRLDTDSTLPVLIKTRGWMFWIYFVYNFVLMILSTHVLIKASFLQNNLRGGQRLLLSIGILVIWAGNSASALIINHSTSLDLTPMITAMGMHLIVIGLFPFQLFSIVPIARNRLIENMQEGMIILSEQKRILDINSAARQIMKYKGSRIIGQPLSSTLIENYPEIEPCFSEDSKDHKITIHRGDNRYLEYNISTMFDQQQRFIGYLISIRDITDQKNTESQLISYRDHLEELVNERTNELTVINTHLEEQIVERMQIENELRNQKSLIERIITTIPNAVIVVNNNFEIVLVNREFYKTFEIMYGTERQYIQSVIQDIYLFAAIQKAQTDRRTQQDIEIRRTITGSDRILITTILPMRQKEVLVIFRDVTEERKRQENMYLTDRLASIGEMAAGVAHELNNPLTGITGLSQLLLENGTPPEVKEDLRIIHDEAKRAAAIVKNMLTFARKHSASRQPTQVNELLQNVLELRAYEHKSQNICVSTSFDPNLPYAIIDGFQMQQVFLNIILNAESAMIEAHQKGHLAITTEQVDDIVKISFADDGPGIAPENISRIFDPFFTTKEVGKGTGLGLSICYGIVSSHNGRISVKSDQNTGASFSVELPLAISVVP